MEDKTKAEDKKHSQNSGLFEYLRSELTRGYKLEHDEQRYMARREKVYTFMQIPRELEKFVGYGFFQCVDSFLFVFTFLPLRFSLAAWGLIIRPVLQCLGYQKRERILRPSEMCDFLKGIIMICCCHLVTYIDTSVMYHLIKSQSVIKLYIFFNMLDVGDRLFSAFGQDTVDALFWTATEPKGRKREHFGVLPHLFLTMVYVFLHTLLVLFQATTLNVAINSSNKALLTIMMSNNFVELKGSVFRKFDKYNLFQVSCSDIRERFHLFALLFVVVVQTMKEYSWKEERFWVLAPECLTVLLCEVFVDWIKHAFITRFNEIPVEVYKDYTASLAYDLAQTKQKHAYSDHSDLVARRMGFIPLPLGVVMIRIIGQAIKVRNAAGVILFVIGYLCLLSLRVLNGIVILGKACDLIEQHQKIKPGTYCSKATQLTEDTKQTPEKSTELKVLYGKSSSHPCSRASSEERKKHVLDKLQSVSLSPTPSESTHDLSSGNTSVSSVSILKPLFSNSTVSIAGVCLNEEVLDKAHPEKKKEMDRRNGYEQSNVANRNYLETQTSHPKSRVNRNKSENVSPVEIIDDKSFKDLSKKGEVEKCLQSVMERAMGGRVSDLLDNLDGTQSKCKSALSVAPHTKDQINSVTEENGSRIHKRNTYASNNVDSNDKDLK